MPGASSVFGIRQRLVQHASCSCQILSFFKFSITRNLVSSKQFGQRLSFSMRRWKRSQPYYLKNGAIPSGSETESYGRGRLISKKGESLVMFILCPFFIIGTEEFAIGQIAPPFVSFLFRQSRVQGLLRMSIPECQINKTAYHHCWTVFSGANCCLKNYNRHGALHQRLKMCMNRLLWKE